jgi:hypothetical protein
LLHTHTHTHTPQRRSPSSKTTTNNNNSVPKASKEATHIMKTIQSVTVALVCSLANIQSSQGFVGIPAVTTTNTPSSQSTTTSALALGIPKFFLPQEEQEKETLSSSSSKTKQEEKKLDVKGLLQLITAGAGAPFLGDFEGVDEETGKFMFSLEANVRIRKSSSCIWYLLPNVLSVHVPFSFLTHHYAILSPLVVCVPRTSLQQNLVDEKGNSKQTSMPYFESGCKSQLCQIEKLRSFLLS